MQDLERRGLLDRKVESLPDDAALAERQKAGLPLTRPELGVLLAFAKIALKVDLLAGGVAADEALDDELLRYFPAKMAGPYAADIEAHPLRAEIIATLIANAMIDRGGPTYVLRMSDRTAAAPVDDRPRLCDGPRRLRTSRRSTRRSTRSTIACPGWSRSVSIARCRTCS